MHAHVFFEPGTSPCTVRAGASADADPDAGTRARPYLPSQGRFNHRGSVPA